jgi:hypothetical protein
MIGPQPPKPGEEISPEEAIKRNIEARAQKMEDKLLGRNQNDEPKRETWMTELPKTVSKNFGLGPRQFSRSTNAKTKQDKTWTQTPNEIAAGEGAEEAPEQDEEVWYLIICRCSLQNEFLTFNEGIVKFVTFTIVSLHRILYL